LGKELSQRFNQINAPIKLQILDQPSDQHRARYSSEGSRGAVKDASGEGSPKFKLIGYNQSTVDVIIYVANEKGLTKPHVFFRACKIASRNSTPCEEVLFENTKAIKIKLHPKDDMVGLVDCVGILKLRNADVENKWKSSSSQVQPKPKRKNPIVRLAFRAEIPKEDGSTEHVEEVSVPIRCSQPEGQPEILKMSSLTGSPDGGEEIIVIGKNFNKNCSIIFQSLSHNWKSVAEINQGFFHKEHLVVSTPKFKETELTEDVHIQVMIKSGEKVHDPFEKEFVYEKTTQKEVPENVEGKLREMLLQDPAYVGKILEMIKSGQNQQPNDLDDMVAPVDMKTDLSKD
jgi:nuclear factor of activated T-cells 5